MDISITEFFSHTITHEMKMPEEGQRVLALYKGEWIVLEVGVESPTYEEPYFPPFKYWFEPFFNMLDIEYDDVTEWRELPDKGINK
ncbi:MAG: hypothetical protein GOVbin2917_113 [Prokaryotic dsDNA virus sp.]|jgi:hypothetical protein|nr:MAG: hypothetical protein GOVbin2917_113 [Prokaryotic dsDNA virus sp.]|tara:strand:- start:31923 stop:32180 length:258 start_codon:yes stop_codon:yes gene_type:complete